MQARKEKSTEVGDRQGYHYISNALSNTEADETYVVEVGHLEGF